MLGIRCVGVCGCQSEDPFVCFGVKPTQRACARDQKDEGRKVREKIEDSQQKVQGEDSQEMRVGQSRGRRYNTKACSIKCDVTLVDLWIARFMTTLNYNHQVFFLIKILKLLKM